MLPYAFRYYKGREQLKLVIDEPDFVFEDEGAHHHICYAHWVGWTEAEQEKDNSRHIAGITRTGSVLWVVLGAGGPSDGYAIDFDNSKEFQWYRAGPFSPTLIWKVKTKIWYRWHPLNG